MGGHNKYFVICKDESFESLQRERHYRIRRDYPDRRYHDVQSFFWGLGTVAEVFKHFATPKQEKQESCGIFLEGFEVFS